MEYKAVIQLTKEQAVEFCEKKSWEPLTLRQRAEFQMCQRLLCMPFDVFHEAVEKTLGRPVYTHEFGSIGHVGLMAELFGGKESPTLQEIIDMIPAEKRIIIMT